MTDQKKFIDAAKSGMLPYDEFVSALLEAKASTNSSHLFLASVVDALVDRYTSKMTMENETLREQLREQLQKCNSEIGKQKKKFKELKQLLNKISEIASNA